MLRHETALGQLNVSEEGTLLPGFVKGRSTTLAWDNDDFKEETKTGKGTTQLFFKDQLEVMGMFMEIELSCPSPIH